MQPTYLPWLGYFSLIDKVDKFVFLDSVQLVKRSWQVRNRIKFNDQEVFLTVPVLKKEHRNEMLIYNSLIDYEQNWKEKHLKTIKYAYNKTPYFNEVYDFIQEIFNKEIKYLGDFNINLIINISERIGIKTNFYKSSEMKDLIGKKDELLANICSKIGCNIYLSARGSSEYIEKETPGGSLVKKGIDLYYQNYEHPTYKQIGKNFIPYLSIIDLLFNVGFDDAINVIRLGNKKDIHYSEIKNI